MPDDTMMPSDTEGQRTAEFCLADDGGPAVRFRGVALAHASTWRKGSWRWTEFRVYRTDGGRIVLHKVGRSDVPGEVQPPEGEVGFGYMLAGGGTPSNVDPYAAEPATGEIQEEPPHVMIFNLPEPAMDYPRPDEEMDMTQPWVMWKDTPYEHLMIPVE